MSWPFRTGIIFNPEAGRNRRRDRDLLGMLEKLGPTKSAVTPADAAAALRSFARMGLNHVIISAGDSTVQAVLTCLFRDRPFSKIPMLTALPGGTTNLIALDSGPKGRQRDSAARALEIKKCSCSGNIFTKKRGVIRLSAEDGSMGGTGRQLQRYGMFAGFGILSKGVDFYHRRLHESGLWGAPGILMTALGYLLPAIFGKEGRKDRTPAERIELDGKALIEGPISAGLATTLERLFFGIRPFWAEGNRPLKMTVMVNRPRAFFRLLPALLSGRKDPRLSPENGYCSFRFSRAALRLTGPVALDGELICPEGTGQHENHEDRGASASLKPWNCTLEYGGRVTFISW